MLIQQTFYPKTEEILIELHFFLKGSLLEEIFPDNVVLLFLHYHTQTCILSCVFFMYLTSLPSFGSSGLLFFFFFFPERTQRLWIITLNKDTILENIDEVF